MQYAVAGLQVLGMGSSAIGAYGQAASEKSRLDYQARMSETNARVDELGAQAALDQGAKQYQASRLRTAQTKSAQRAALAANGVDLSSGSAIDLQTSTDYMGAEDAATIEANAARQAWGYRMSGVDAMNQARLARTAGASISPAQQAFTSLLGNAGQVASSWYRWSKMGADTKAPTGVKSDNPAPTPWSFGAFS